MSFLFFLLCLLFRFLRLRKDGTKCENQKTQPSSTECGAESVQKRPSALTIETLPVEIQQNIASFLTPDSATCFVLCSKSLQWVVGQQSLCALLGQDQKKARLNFLAVLQRDLRECLLCYQCEKLHPFKLEPHFDQRWRFLRENPCSYADGFLSLRPAFELRFKYAQMIMKLYQLRATENIFLDSLSHANAREFKGHVSHSHTSARIRNDNLLLKLELRVLLCHGDSFKQVKTLCQRVCLHWECRLEDEKLSKIIRCQMSHGPGQSCPACTGMIQCQRCSTEFVVAFLDSNWSPRGQAIYITVWKDLGPCDTPFDIHWRTQVGTVFSSFPAPNHSVPFEPGSILRAYEDFANSSIGVDGLSGKWPLDSDVEFFRVVADIGK